MCIGHPLFAFDSSVVGTVGDGDDNGEFSTCVGVPMDMDGAAGDCDDGISDGFDGVEPILRVFRVNQQFRRLQRDMKLYDVMMRLIADWMHVCTLFIVSESHDRRKYRRTVPGTRVPGRT